MSRILVVAAHPDDEVLGCGATLARHRARDDDVHVVYIADGVSGRGVDKRAIERRAAAAAAACRVLGAKPARFLDLPDGRLDGVPLLDIIQPLEEALAALAPALVYTHHPSDLNVDHRVTHRAVMTACRPLPGQTVREIRSFEVPSSSEWSLAGDGGRFRPNLFVDVAASFDTKLRALACYHEELRPYPHPRSERALRALAEVRGATAGCDLAEAFEIVRKVEADCD